MAQLFSNAAVATLAAGIDSTTTTIPLATGKGALFPILSGSDFFLLTLTQAGASETSWEVVKVTARSGDTLTAVRGFEGSASSWSAGDKAELRITAATLNNFALGGSVVTDQNWSSVAFLANFEGGAVDVANKCSITLGASAAVATDKAKFGAKSLRIPGAGSYAALTPGAGAMDFGTADFTVEFHVWVVNYSSYGFLFDGRPNGGGASGHMILDLDTSGVLHYGDVTTRITAGSAIPTGQWVHVALCRVGGNTRLFFDGMQTGATYADSTNLTIPSGRPYFGGSSNSPGNYCVNVYFDNIRVCKGVGRYASNFTPPAEPFPTNATYSSSYCPRSSRASNTMLGVQDRGYVIDVTSGTFTQTFDDCATLGAGWYCWLKNSGGGDITLDPFGSQQIDGLTSYVMYPGECRLVQCDGSALRSVVLTPFYKVFTSTDTWTKPPGYQRFDGDLWAGGCGGGRGSGGYHAGGGGACAEFRFPASALGATETVTIGSGGAARTTNGSPNVGGNSTFAGVTAYSGDVAGYGGSAYFTGGLNDAITPGNGSGGVPNYLAGGNGLSSLISGDLSKNSVKGGGAGGAVASDNTTLRAPGDSIFGGDGGAASVSGNGTAGTVPGGGGGSTVSGTQSGPGARGEMRIWGVV